MRSLREALRLALVLSAAALLTGFAFPIPAAKAATSGSTKESISVTDVLSFVPSNIQTGGLSVFFEVQNSGTTNHTFTVSSRVNATAPSGTSADNVTGNWFDGPHVLADKTVNAGQVIFLNVTFSTPGTYQFICRLHFPQMAGSITVGMGPGSSSYSGSWLWIIVGVVIAVIVVAAVVALGMRRRKRPPTPATPPTQP